MSENEKNDAYKQTSSIPLKKETVRVTLKASDAPPAKPHGATKDAPTQRPTPTTRSTPTAPKPTARPAPPVPAAATPEPEAPAAAAPAPAPEAPTSSPVATQPAAPAPPTPSAPKPPTAPVAGIARKAPAPTIPLKTAGLKPSGAPTVKLSTSSGAPVAGAPTIALKTAGTAPLPGAGVRPTASLPKATVALNPPTQPLTASADPSAPGQPTTAGTVSFAEEDESGATTFTNILAGVGLAAAIIVLSLQLSMASTWISAEDNENQGEWSQLLD